ncbi:DNA-protecting protein DprA [Frankia sp. AgB1.9]|uniref:DNA-processing protein DprA n=1 Tax=unclassified Frankia TaxID=2632575 RepID=UPI0019334785|nr:MULTISPECIES: DNA-processing protein DprA [unclassified Frankia]MBL7487602.1 DNA-protecting protein DprA [Frankia sp. AgW1.1]MBL7548932.1 DNA-protecting protein DprA [Frankia sp. AgB1.9]MBL7624900.1 DNA-protecting protein DprA [Frankia sp. AgB1.8]
MSSLDEREAAALVALLQVRPSGIAWQDIVELVGLSGSARAVWDRLVPPTLFEDTDLASALHDAAASVTAWRDEAFTFTTFLDDDYPRRLRGVRQTPPVIFYAGQAKPDEKAVSIVGSRQADDNALAFAATLARSLVDRNLTVLAGLAAGVDTAAHQAALDANGRTVAVIGTGIRKYYPPQNHGLQDQIARTGLVLSQFWPDASPTKRSFPMRNATMSAYGYATVVVAAGEHSGARIQAREAIAHGRPVILTRRVAESTEWGRALIGQPGVYLAATVEEAADRIDHIFSLDDRLAEITQMMSRGASG